MSDTAPATHVTVAAPSFLSTVSWGELGKAVCVVAVAAAVFYLEMTGHADKGTFINVIAMPVLAGVGLHTAITRFTGAPNA